ncbi:hypothetical protein [Granulicoccus sp. GXG6511]|uniref:hypothetical protein n=1 Tax=Granulicoccus sp. GXG6511 TaxID=3381351 RepID=UPI003D7C5C38
MTADVRVALFGPAAEAWRGALPERVRDHLSGPDDSVVWVVDGDGVPTQVPPGCMVIVFSLGEMPENDLPNVWHTVETPERWMPSMFAALAEGRTLPRSIEIGGPIPIKFEGKPVVKPKPKRGSVG